MFQTPADPTDRIELQILHIFPSKPKPDFCKDKAKWAEFSIPPTTLALFGEEDDAPIRSGPGGSAVVLAISDFEGTLEELETSGIEVTWQKEFGPCHMAMISNPCGNPIFIHERKDGTFG